MFHDFDLVETVLTPAIAHPVGEHAIARRAGDVRLRGQELVRLARLVGRRYGEKATLECAFGCRGAGGEAVDCRHRSLR